MKRIDRWIASASVLCLVIGGGLVEHSQLWAGLLITFAWILMFTAYALINE